MKQIELSPAVYEILHELSMRKRVKPDMLAKSLVKEEYKKTIGQEKLANFLALFFAV